MKPLSPLPFIGSHRKLTERESINLSRRLRAHYHRGKTVHQLADETGRSFGNIYRLLKLAGTVMRERGRVPKKRG